MNYKSGNIMKNKATKMFELLDGEYKFEELLPMNEKNRFQEILRKNLNSTLNKYVKDSLISKMTDDLLKKLFKQ